MKNQTGSLEMVRHLNQKLVLDVIRRQEPISRAQISKQLSLSRSTVSQIVDWLLENHLVFEVGTQNTDVKTCGRPGQMLRFNPLSAYIVGMVLTARETTVCVADMRGNPVFRAEYSAVSDAQGVYQALCQVLQAAEIDEKKIARLSVSVPGIANAEGKVRASRLKWRNYDLPTQFRQYCDIPIHVNNDVNLALIGERRFGLGGNHDNLVYLSLGTGIGCGIMCDGKMVLGSTFAAGEIQYLAFNASLDNQGPCARLEDVIGMNCFASYPGGFSGLIQRYTQGDPQSSQVIEKFIRTLSTTIAFIISLLNPSLVIIGGRMGSDMEDIIEDVREDVEKLTPYKTEIQLTSLKKNESCLLGAVAYALEQIDQE